jgi:thiol-disulfide isomerase/thioredoxin
MTEPSNLLVFSEYRQVAPGVEWPMRCERLLVGYAGRRAEDGFDYTRCEIIYEEATTEASFDLLVPDTLPQEGDTICDHRFDVPVKYDWKEGLTEADVQSLVDTKRRELQESQAIIEQFRRPLNEMVGKPAPPLPESGWLVDSESPIAKRLGGRPYLLHFWATWCGPCKNELPIVESLHEDGLTVIGVHPGGGGPEQAEHIQGFVREQGLEYPQLLAAKGDENVAGYPVRMYPYSVVVDADGHVAAHGFLKPELIRTFRQREPKKQD